MSVRTDTRNLYVMEHSLLHFLLCQFSVRTDTRNLYVMERPASTTDNSFLLCQDRHPESLCDGTIIQSGMAGVVVRTDTRNLYVMEHKSHLPLLADKM
ncbi:Uncharacterized protein dnm_064930 [Desulfonema magnum]|uniref:Uncharacterized protein n=1 Tax=Desulfonema magnum TaxID=45655 RepID=A0A975GR13_9BACT|nr:Uncharacterized protein dnm_064930 [Desulfonema magnum]